MTRKRRMFDIDMPEEDGAAPGSAEPRISTLGERRGPMASAVRENADALRSRSEAERAIRAENDALAHEFVAARAAGLVLTRVPLDAVQTRKLSRDRADVDPDGLEELKASLREIGLSNPIQVEAAGAGVELVQGLRRLTAFRALLEETGDPAWAEIPAVVLPEGESMERLYRRMVDENLVRTDISFAEMAALALRYADDPSTDAADVDAAVTALYGSAGKQKRSYIRAFAKLMVVLEKYLDHPRAIPRALGLAVRRRIEEAPETLAGLQRALQAAPRRDAETELEILRRYAEPDAPAAPTAPFPAGNPAPARPKAPRKARITFQVAGPEGPVRCTASHGRLDLAGETDFSAIDRRRLEAAVTQLVQALLSDKKT